MKQRKIFTSMILSAAIMFSTAVSGFAASSGGYDDVKETDWYCSAVADMKEKGLMYGVSDTEFSPDGDLTRAMLVTIIYRMAGEPAVSGDDDFEDTKSGSWYSNAVLWASQKEVVAGYGNGNFGTNDPVTQEQLIAILWRYAGEPASETTETGSASSWAIKAVSWAKTNELIDENSYEFAPKENASRAQIASILSKYLAEPAKTDTPEVQNPETDSPEKGSKALVAYFAVAENSDVDAVSSASRLTDGGETKGMDRFIGEIIAEKTKGDLFSIQTEEKFSGEYNTLLDNAQEMKNNGEMPALSSHIENLDDYDVIFVGYPIWWGALPQVMESFFSEYDFSGKTIVPFCTHGGSGNSGTFSKIAELEPNADVKDGIAINMDNVSGSKQNILDWLDKLGF
ncbi:MAG: S-layer homology domain-containing protein [Firmicutes bacterium]|nr:S-layer homology domain-containing protein [Bacillota bacterium]